MLTNRRRFLSTMQITYRASKVIRCSLLLALVSVAELSYAGPASLTFKIDKLPAPPEWEGKTSKAPVLRMDKSLVCAIPLREIRAGSGKRMDPIALPARSTSFDKMTRQAPIDVCPRD